MIVYQNEVVNANASVAAGTSKEGGWMCVGWEEFVHTTVKSSPTVAYVNSMSALAKAARRSEYRMYPLLLESIS